MSLPRHHPALGLVLLLVAAGLAGCVTDLDPGADAPAARFASVDDAKAAGGPTLEPLDADSRVRVQLISPAGHQALDTGANEFVVLVFSQRTQEPVLDATVAVETDRGESARLAEDAHGVYAGEVTLTGVGETPARVTVVDADGRTLVFPLELASYGSVADVSATNSLVYEPTAGDGSLRLKLLNPEEPLAIDAGVAPFTFQLLDADTGEPVTGAEASLGSWMPPHGLPEGGRMPGHGTHSEVDPVHHRLGIYQGQWNIVMNGTWWTNVTVTVDGTDTTFRVTSDAGSGGHTHGDDGHDDHDHSHDHSFDSFTAAMAAHGPEVEMTNGSASMTAKLLVPTGNVSTGKRTIKFLLHRPEADRPAPVALARHVELDVHKHAHDGGTVHANTTGIVHSGSGVWTARTNLTESGEWSVHVDIATLEGTVFDTKFEVTVDGASGGDGEDCHYHGDEQYCH